MKLASSKKKRIQQSLLKWYQQSKRNLPWRQTSDPYAIWVSEIMLQQTQVDTVIPYYERWLKIFPSVEKLARAKEEKVLKLWEGLGYYSRARNLRKAAQWLNAHSQGKLPETPQALRKLPGIGPYTAGAISSIAFNHPTPAVDGNVLRVFSRLFAIESNIKDRQSLDLISSLVQQLFPQTHSGDMTQAWMELGATLCLPVHPQCLICPIAKDCAAKKQNRVDQFPIISKRPKIKKIVTAALILKNQDSVLLEKRALGKIMGGLWVFPTVELLGPIGKTVEFISALFKKEHGLEILLKEQLLTLTHSYTVYRAKLNVYNAELQEEVKMKNSLKWVSLKKLKQFPFPSAHAKIANFILN